MVVLVPVVMAAAAIMAVLVMMVVLMAMVMMLMVVVRMAVLIAVGVSVAVGVAFAMAVAMVMMVVVMPVVVIADMGAALRLEGALDRGCGAALPSHQLGHGRAVLHIEGIARDLDEAVAAAEMPGETDEAQGVLGPHFQQGLGRRLHLDEPAVLEPQGIAVVDRGLHVEIEMDLGAALACSLPWRRLRASWSSVMMSTTRSAFTAGLRTMVVTRGMGQSRSVIG